MILSELERLNQSIHDLDSKATRHKQELSEEVGKVRMSIIKIESKVAVIGGICGGVVSLVGVLWTIFGK